MKNNELRCAIYLRVSTKKQGASGLGLEAQRKMCMDFINHKHGTVEKEFIDVESGTHRERKGLWDAIDYCKSNSCGLVIAKLDRLARDVEFTFRVINTGVEIFFTDMPMVNTMILGVFASVAQYERELISTRTKHALAAKKKRGEKVGAATEKWKASMTPEKIAAAHRSKGHTRNNKNLQSSDVKAFEQIVQSIFPCYSGKPIYEWGNWELINTKRGTREQILGRMLEYQKISQRFSDWNFDENETKLQMRLASYIASLKRAVKRYKQYV